MLFIFVRSLSNFYGWTKFIYFIPIDPRPNLSAILHDNLECLVLCFTLCYFRCLPFTGTIWIKWKKTVLVSPSDRRRRRKPAGIYRKLLVERKDKTIWAMEMRHTHYPQGLLMSPPGGLDYLKMPMQAMQLGPNGELIPTGMQTHHHGHGTTGKEWWTDWV